MQADHDQDGDWVLIEQGLTPTEAEMLASCLRAAGIDAYAGDTELVRMDWLWMQAVGGAKIRVRAAQLAAAQQALQAYRRGDYALGEDFDPGDAKE